MKGNGKRLLEQIYAIPLDAERYLIYAPLKGMAFLGNPALVNVLVDDCRNVEKPGFFEKPGFLQDLDFLRKLNFFQAEPLPVDEYQHKGVRYDAVVLFLTNQCNLRCSYCYAFSGEYPPKMMTWEVAQAAIDFVAQEVHKQEAPAMTLGFHGGGEPTLNWDILTKAVDYARALAERQQIPLHVSGAFNGYWPQNVLRYILRNFTDLSLSFDGLPAVQNLQRPAKGQPDSFTRVAETLHALDHAQFPYGIRMTVTNETVTQLADSIAFICAHFRPQKIQVEPVFEEGRARLNRSAITDLNIFVDQFRKGFTIATEHQITLFYSGARLDVLNTRFCLAACRAFVVTPEGDVTACFETYGREHPLSPHFLVGSYQGNGRFEIEAEKLQRHFDRTIRQIPYCAHCFCKWHCAGDCAIKTVAAETGDGFQPSARCFVNQELTKFLLLRKIQASGGVMWVKEPHASNAPHS